MFPVDYDKVIEHFGSPSKLAAALNIKRQAVSLWKGRIPLMRQYQIEAITNGKFKAQDKAA